MRTYTYVYNLHSTLVHVCAMASGQGLFFLQKGLYIYYIWVVHKMVRPQIMTILMLMDWLQGQSTGNHRSSYEIWVLPVIFSLKPIH